MVQDSVSISKSQINNLDEDFNYAEFQVNWTNPSQIPQLVVIPLRYEITWNGQTYHVNSEIDEYGFYSASFSQGHMWITANDDPDGGDKGMIWIGSDGNGVEAGVYQFSVFAPDADGGELRQDFTLIVTDDSTAKTSTTVTVTVPDVSFGDALQPNVEVKNGDTVISDAEVEYYINGWKAEPSQLIAQTFHNIKLGDNELRVVYKGSDTYAPSVGTASFRVSKATNTKVIADLSAASNKVFDGKALEATLADTPTVRTKGGSNTVLDADAKVSIEYQLDGKAVKEVVFPGTYTVVLVVAEGEMYGAFEQTGPTIKVNKAKPAVTVDAVDRGNGVVELTAEV